MDKKLAATLLLSLLMAFNFTFAYANSSAEDEANNTNHVRAKEYQIKAAFLYNFAHFVSWPQEAYATPTSPLYICVSGKNPFGKILSLTTEGVKIQGHPLESKVQAGDAEMKLCHILFIEKSESFNLQSTLKNIAQQPVLTISDMDDFICAGGMIQFYTEEKRLRLAINYKLITSLKLQVDANLLRLVKIQSTEECPS